MNRQEKVGDILTHRQQPRKLPSFFCASLGGILSVIIMIGMVELAGASVHPLVQPMESFTWTLVWSDEFSGTNRSTVNNANWGYDIGDGCSAGICGWGNNEKEYYSNSLENASVNGSGQLSITARVVSNALTCYYGPCRYTSAKIKTKAKIEQLYGRFEARIKLPEGQGLWPAFWMLGNNHPSTSWPNSGEIDIMEYRGSITNTISSAMHGPGYFGNTPIAHAYTLSSSTFTDDFHVFAIEWEPDQIRFYVDNTVHYTATKAAVQQYGTWVFDHPFFIILNLAVGGHFDGDPVSDSVFPATMLVDYVRVYARSVIYLPVILRS